MATYVSGTVTVAPSNGSYTVANLRAWINEMRACFSGAGLVQTSDTGQVNPATTDPAAVADAGYEIWRFSDAEQSTNPIFLRIRYRRGSANGLFTLFVQAGTGTDGAGNLTGTVSSTFDCRIANNSSSNIAGVGTHYAYFGRGTFWLADAVDSTCPAYSTIPRTFFLVARTRDDTNAIDGRGFLVCVPNGGFDYSGANISQFVRTVSGSELVHIANSQYSMIVGTPTNDYLPGTTDRMAWPHFYYDRGVGIKKAYSHFSVRNVGLQTTPMAFQANPFGFGNAWWTTWDTAPRAVDTNWSGAALVVPWDAP